MIILEITVSSTFTCYILAVIVNAQLLIMSLSFLSVYCFDVTFSVARRYLEMPAAPRFRDASLLVF